MTQFIPKPRTKEQFLLIVLLLAFGTIYGLISFVNHYQFRTYALDLGMFNHALYNFAHFEPNYFTLNANGFEPNYFGDHFSPITMLYAPLYYLFGSYTMLVIQIGALLFGGYGVYNYAKERFTNTFLPHLILVQFLGSFAIYSAVAFDFHNNVVGAMLVPWLVYYYEKNERLKTVIYLVLILFTKENMGLWLLFIFMGLSLGKLIRERKQAFKSIIRFEVPIIVGCIVYTIIVLSFIMPYFRDGEGISQLDRYAHLGDSPGEIIHNFMEYPIGYFSYFYSNPINPALAFIKEELHYVLFLSGGIFLFIYPRFLIMLIPIYAQKLLSDNFTIWGINGHYSIEFVPIISLALIHTLLWIKRSNIQVGLASIAVLSTFYINFDKLEKRDAPYYQAVNHQFYARAHYHSSVNKKEAYQAIRKVPAEVTISATSNLVPHLANRSRIYSFPHIKDAKFMALLKDSDFTYPQTKEEFKRDLERFRSNEEWTVFYENNTAILFKRKE